MIKERYSLINQGEHIHNMIELKEITKEDFDDILNLKVAAHQISFVSTVADSLAQAWLYRDTAFPFAIYADGLPDWFCYVGVL